MQSEISFWIIARNCLQKIAEAPWRPINRTLASREAFWLVLEGCFRVSNENRKDTGP